MRIIILNDIYIYTCIWKIHAGRFCALSERLEGKSGDNTDKYVNVNRNEKIELVSSKAEFEFQHY